VIWVFTRSGSAESRSILLMTGIDLQVVLQGQVHVGQSLGLHALAGVDQQQGPFTGGERPGDFVGEIDMAGGVDQVRTWGRPSLSCRAGRRLALDGDAPLAFDVHAVEI